MTGMLDFLAVLVESIDSEREVLEATLYATLRGYGWEWNGRYFANVFYESNCRSSWSPTS